MLAYLNCCVCTQNHASMTEYNDERPHDSLGRIPPAMFRRRVEKLENSRFKRSH